LLSTTAVEIAA